MSHGIRGALYHSTPFASGFPYDDWSHFGTRAAALQRARYIRPAVYGLPADAPVTLYVVRVSGRVYPHILDDDVANDIGGTGYVREIDEGLPSGEGYHAFPYRNDAEDAGMLSYLVHRTAIRIARVEIIPRHHLEHALAEVSGAG